MPLHGRRYMGGPVASPGCLVWREAHVGMRLSVAPTPEPGTDCVPSMSFKRYSCEEARHLLDGMHLLLMGDSVAQYWYTALAYFLHSCNDLKQWDAERRGHAHPLYETWWLGPDWFRKARWWAWNTYYNTTSADLGDEICDCWRDKCHPFCSPQSYFGNRYLHHGRAGRLSLVMSLGNLVRPRWHALDRAGWRLHCKAYMDGVGGRRCMEGSPAHRDLSKASLRAAIDAVSQEFAPDVMLVNVRTNWADSSLAQTRWYVPGPCGFAKEYMLGLSHSIPARARSPALWLWNDLETSAYNNVTHVNVSGMCTVVGHNARMLAVPALVARLLLLLPRTSVYIDAAHFQPWVYHELIQVLLNVLGSHTWAHSQT